MLRGHRSCAISERPTPSPTLRLLATSHPPLATSSVTSLFPLMQAILPQVLCFPLIRKTRGSPSNMTSSSISVFSPSMLTAASSKNVGTPKFLISARLLFSADLCVLCASALSFSFFVPFLPTSHCFENSVPNSQLSAINAKTAYITLRLSITIINNVGAPTYFSCDRTARNQHLMDRGAVFSSRCGLLTGHPARDAHPERATRAEGSLRHFSPKSNHSRTYVKTEGGGMLFLGRPQTTHLYILPIFYLQLRYTMSARRHFRARFIVPLREQTWRAIGDRRNGLRARAVALTR